MKRPFIAGHPRRGAALFIAILLMSLLVLVLGTLTRLGLAERAQARSEERRLNATWLAESGLERAFAKLRADAGYLGEAWELSPESLRSAKPALVLIRVEAVADRSDMRRVTARADFPKEGTSRARQTRSALINVPITQVPRGNP